MNFDWLAPHYRWLEFVLAGSKLQRCRTAFLPGSPGAKQILIAGEGNGRFLVECRRQFPAAQITCLDASAPMLHSARRRLLRAGLLLEGVNFLQTDILDWTPPESRFELLVTNFFLDCFPPDQLNRVVSRLALAAAPQATWWLADFQIPAMGLARMRARLIHWAMYTFFRVATRLPARHLTAPDVLLTRQGFVRRRHLVSEWGLLHADEWHRLELRSPRS